jgi:hypothetical protein
MATFDICKPSREAAPHLLSVSFAHLISGQAALSPQRLVPAVCVLEAGVTAAAEDRTSFGCAADNDWTYFGDAMINRELRKPQPLAAAFAETVGLVSSWDAQGAAVPSNP